MRHPVIVVFEADGRLARELAALAAERHWLLRESRQIEPCLKLLAGGGPAVLVVRVTGTGPPLELLAVANRLPGVRIIAVGDATESEVLAGLAWDLGVDYALFPPTPAALLPDIVAGLLGGGL